MDVSATSSELDYKSFKMRYKFNGSYIANCTIIYPSGKKVNIQANLAEGNLIKGVTIELNKHISSLTDQIINTPADLKNQKMAIFQFPTLGKRYTLFGDYIGENIINEFSKRGFKIVERGLLKEIFKEFKLNQLGVVEYGRNEIDKVIKITGASAIITGTVSLINEDVVINCRVISKNGDIISTGKEVIKRYLIPKHYFETLGKIEENEENPLNKYFSK
jgi:TolB-like protein